MTFLEPAPVSEAAQRLFDQDRVELGYVMNASRLWAYRPDLLHDLFALLGQACKMGGLSFRDRAILVLATASQRGDSYCSLAWGTKLGDGDLAAAVIRDDAERLAPRERALAAWARQVVRDPNTTGPADVQALRNNGFGEEEIFAITAFVALRLAFSTVNDALGAQPDAEFRTTAPPQVLAAAGYGRPMASS